MSNEMIITLKTLLAGPCVLGLHPTPPESVPES